MTSEFEKVRESQGYEIRSPELKKKCEMILRLSRTKSIIKQTLIAQPAAAKR